MEIIIVILEVMAFIICYVFMVSGIIYFLYKKNILTLDHTESDRCIAFDDYMAKAGF